MSQATDDIRQFQRYPWAKQPYWVPVPKWIRAGFGGAFVADSRRVMLKRGFPMIYYFPREDVNMEMLEISDHTETDKFGEAIFWNLKSDKSTVKNAAWCIDEPNNNAPENISNYIGFKWKSMDTWMEEDELVRVHPRDPYSRIDTIHSSRHVKIVIHGEIIAESTRPTLLFETGLPTRYYLNRMDVRMDLLQPTDYRTECPYKGEASYFSAIIGQSEVEHIAWAYPFPNMGVIKIKDLLCFHTERVDEFILDGETQPAPQLKKPE